MWRCSHNIQFCFPIHQVLKFFHLGRFVPVFLPLVHHAFLLLSNHCNRHSLCKNRNIMVAEIQKVVMEYKRRLQRTPLSPRLSYECPMLAEDGGPNAMFFTCLFCDEPMALEFLQDVGLLQSKEQCNTYGGDMTWSEVSSGSDGYRWRCRRRTGGTKCSDSRSIKYSPWFHQSNLYYHEILLITYGIVCREHAL